jgi:hypothetical protein
MNDCALSYCLSDILFLMAKDILTDIVWAEEDVFGVSGKTDNWKIIKMSSRNLLA